MAVVAVRVARDADAPSSSDDGRAVLQAVLPDLVAFVEQNRGLRFREPPDVRLLPDEEFEAMLLAGGGEDIDVSGPAAEDAAFVGLLRALGLVEGRVDLDDVASEAAANIVGFYDTETKALYARGAEPTPYVMDVLVHELTHALDDQHFDIDRADLEDDAAAAFDALVEGSAVVIEERWLLSRPRSERDEIETQDGTGGPATADSVFTALVAFPYAVGPRLVEALLGVGEGMARLDAAFREPPNSTEQVLHPDRFLRGEQPVPVEAPTADGAPVEEGVLGELGLLLVLDSQANRASAQRAATGWACDRYVTWARGRQTCVRWVIVMDTPADATELRSTLRPWLSANRNANVSGTDPLVLTNCA